MAYLTGFGSKKRNDLLVCILRVWRITGPLLYMDKGQFPVRKNSAKCEKVRAKYVTGMCSDSSQTVRAKKFLSEKS